MITITVYIIAQKIHLSIGFLKIFKKFFEKFLEREFLAFAPFFDFTFTHARDIIYVEFDKLGFSGELRLSTNSRLPLTRELSR